MDYALPASAGRLRHLTDTFVAEALRPLEADLPPAEGPLPAAVRSALAERRRAAGLWGLAVPAAAGGMGLGWLERAVVQERAHRSPLGMWPQGLLAAGDPPAALLSAGGPAAEAYLAPCLDGRRVAHQIVVPPPAVGGAGLRAVPVRHGAVLHGHWPSVPAFLTEDLLLVVAEMQGRLQGFLCGPGLPGYRLSAPRPGMGAAQLVDVTWDACRLDARRLLPEAGPAALLWRAAQQVTVLGAGAVGAAEHCLAAALEHLRRRHTFGRPLADRQAMQWMVADSARELYAARLLLYRAAAAADGGDEAAALRLAGPAKAYAASAACRIVDRVLQMHGGYGYTRDLPVERFWRDLRLYRLAEGADGELLAAAASELVAELDA